MAVTAVPAAITGLLSQITAAAPAGVDVCDGVVRTGQSSSSFVVVTGWETADRQPATIGGPLHFSVEEHFELTGFIRCLEGSEDQTESRQQAFAVFEAIEMAVRSDPTLGGAVRVAWVSRHAGVQGPADGSRGNGTQIDFTVFCEARL